MVQRLHWNKEKQQKIIIDFDLVIIVEHWFFFFFTSIKSICIIPTAAPMTSGKKRAVRLHSTEYYIINTCTCTYPNVCNERNILLLLSVHTPRKNYDVRWFVSIWSYYSFQMTCRFSYFNITAIMLFTAVGFSFVSRMPFSVSFKGTRVTEGSTGQVYAHRYGCKYSSGVSIVWTVAFVEYNLLVEQKGGRRNSASTVHGRAANDHGLLYKTRWCTSVITRINLDANRSHTRAIQLVYTTHLVITVISNNFQHIFMLSNQWLFARQRFFSPSVVTLPWGWISVCFGHFLELHVWTGSTVHHHLVLYNLWNKTQ